MFRKKKALLVFAKLARCDVPWMCSCKGASRAKGRYRGVARSNSLQTPTIPR